AVWKEPHFDDIAAVIVNHAITAIFETRRPLRQRERHGDVLAGIWMPDGNHLVGTKDASERLREQSESVELLADGAVGSRGNLLQSPAGIDRNEVVAHRLRSDLQWRQTNEESYQQQSPRTKHRIFQLVGAGCRPANLVQLV